MLGGKKKKSHLKHANGKGFGSDEEEVAEGEPVGHAGEEMEGDEPSMAQLDGGTDEEGALDGEDHPSGRGMTEDGETTPGYSDVVNPGSPALHQKKKSHLFGEKPHRMQLMVAIAHAKKNRMRG
jgi:hypothetical protein